MPSESSNVSGSRVRADLPTMHWSGAQLHQAAVDTESMFAAHHSAIDAALEGWTGASRGAMSMVLDKWRTTASAIVTGIADHAGAIHTAAYRYQSEDTAGATSIARTLSTGSDYSEGSLRL